MRPSVASYELQIDNQDVRMETLATQKIPLKMVFAFGNKSST